MENFARTTRKARLALPFRALTALDQEQESGSARSEAGGGGRLGQSEMAITQGKTPFVFGMVINIDTFLDIPAFHQPWKYIETIGVSIFNRRVSTSKHFGFMRATLRVLYNLNEMTDDSAYIVVGDTTNRWRDNKLFIFDDTLLHESINQTDQARYCLFVDMIRPTPFPAAMRATVFVIRLLTESFKFVYYRNWKVIH